MKRTQLELALRVASDLAREREFIIIGSQAILGLMRNPPSACLKSMELDLYPKHQFQAVLLINSKMGPRSRFAENSGFFVDCVDPGLATLPDGWIERLVPFRTKKTGGATGWCLELHDLALAKLAAGRPKDLRYIRALLRHKLVRPEIIESRLNDMPTTPADKQTMRAHLKKLVAPRASKRRRRRKPASRSVRN